MESVGEGDHGVQALVPVLRLRRGILDGVAWTVDVHAMEEFVYPCFEFAGVFGDLVCADEVYESEGEAEIEEADDDVYA